MEVLKGYVINRSRKAKHIFQQTVSPGRKVDLETVFALYGKKIPENVDPVLWITENVLPRDWDLVIEKPRSEQVFESMHKETLTATPIITSGPVQLGSEEPSPDDDEPFDSGGPSKWQYILPKDIEKLSARQISNLKLKDNPKRIIDLINNIYKLRRALTFCKKDGRKDILTRMLQKRIRQLTITL